MECFSGIVRRSFMSSNTKDEEIKGQASMPGGPWDSIDEATLLKLGLGCTHKNWRKYLKYFQERLSSADGILLESLEDEWQMLSAHFGLDKRENLENTASTPLEALDFFLDICTYPPPELLMVIVAQFKTYMMHGGRQTLEEVFFGKEKKGVGNYAARSRTLDDALYQSFHFKTCSPINRLKTQREVAEQFLDEFHTKGIGQFLEIDLRGKMSTTS